MPSSLSIIIPTHGDAPFLVETLESIRQFAGNSFLEECLIVHNGAPSSPCDRQVDKFLSSLDDSVSTEFRYVKEPASSSLAGRHRGYFESTADILAFIDDDVVLGPEWLSGVRDAFEKHDADVAGGPSSPRYLGQTPNWLPVLFDTTPTGGSSSPFLSLLDLQVAKPQEISPLYVWSLNLVIRRNVLEEAGGFHPCVVPEGSLMFGGDGETGLARSLIDQRRKVLYVPAMRVTHIIPDGRLTFRFLEKRARVEGVSLAFSAMRKARSGVRNAFLYRELWGQVAYFMRQADFWSFSDSGKARRFILRHTISGWFYLFSHARRDGRVMQWIGRDNFWDYQLPAAQTA